MADRTCSIDDCTGRAVARGWCRKHYSRWYNHGDPTYLKPWSLPPQNRPRYFGCKWQDCDRPHSSGGYCKLHAERVRYAEKRDEIRVQQAEYRAEHREEALARSQKWRADNPERFKASLRAYQRANADVLREKRRVYRDNNREVIRASNLRRKRLQRDAVSDLTDEDWTTIRDAFEWSCAYCARTDRPLTQDHRIPLSAGGAHTLTNVVPACQSCNSRKGVRVDVPFHPRFHHLE